jgi:hypothetical protein
MPDRIGSLGGSGLELCRGGIGVTLDVDEGISRERLRSRLIAHRMAPPDAPMGSGTQRDPNPLTRRWFHLAEDV